MPTWPGSWRPSCLSCWVEWFRWCPTWQARRPSARYRGNTPMDVWLIVSFIVTLLIFSYIFGDNPLFRLASYAFVGVAAGYTTLLVVYQVLWPRLVQPLMGGNLLLLVPLGLGVILLLKLVPRYARFGSLPMP